LKEEQQRLTGWAAGKAGGTGEAEEKTGEAKVVAVWRWGSSIANLQQLVAIFVSLPFLERMEHENS
jgi:hypothetical protein